MEMPTVYTEIDDSFDFGEAVAPAIVPGTQFIGSLGVLARGDFRDTWSIAVTPGAIYSFTLVADLGESGGFSSRIVSVGLDEEQSRVSGRFGERSTDLTVTADETGQLDVFLQSVSDVSYTLILNSIVFPFPTDGDDTLVGNMNADRVDLLGGNDTYVALGGSDVVIGGMGDDSIDGVCGNDTLFGDEGDDTILGGNGRDVIFGGADNDLINGGNQEDALNGDEGDDTLIGEKGNDTISGGAGVDVIDGGQDDDLLTGGTEGDIFRFRNGDGRDIITDFTVGEDRLDLTALNIWDISLLTIQAGGTGIRINTGNGNYIELTGLSVGDLTNADLILVDPPVIAVTEGGDQITATDIADFFAASGGSDAIRGMGGNDTINGGTGNDTLDGGSGNDLIDGGSGADRINGGEGADTIMGAAGNDVIKGGSGNDLINGQNANDRIYGEDGNDTLFGENGNDQIWGGGGADSIFGGAGKDKIDGGSGNDTIDGGWGDDLMTGGAGNDVFVFADDRTRADTITDFTIGQDVIQIEAYGYTDISDLNMVQTGDDVLITFSDRDSLLLLNVDLADLDNDDFTLSNELIAL
jgi:Ca2+-binding RTX toxin-like protein